MSLIDKFLRANFDERSTIALERIADALDRLAPPPLSTNEPVKEPESTLIALTDEDQWLREQTEIQEQDELHEQSRLKAERENPPQAE